MSNSGNYKETQEVFKLIYFKKLPIIKVLTKLTVLSDASVLLKCWFYKQAPQKVLIELSPGVERKPAAATMNSFDNIKIATYNLQNKTLYILLYILAIEYDYYEF